MTASGKAFFLYPPAPGLGGAGAVPPPSGGVLPEGAPAWLWGQGTPAAIPPFTTVNKGSLYSEVNATDDYTGHVWMKVDEGGDADDWVTALVTPMTLASTYTSSSIYGVEINHTGTLAGGVTAALRVTETTAGTTGSVALGAYVSITQGSTKNVSGYVTAAEFELTNGAAASSALFVLTLDFSDNGATTNTSQAAFFALREYGTVAPKGLFWLGQEFVAAVGATSNTVMWTTTGTGYEDNVDYAIRVMAGDATTPYWIPVCSTGPGG